MRRALTALVLAAGLGLPLVAQAAPVGPTDVCTEVPDPQRWLDAGTPDRGRDRALIAVHRGAAELAPENTIEAFEYAIAYGMDMIEADVQQTVDHQYVVFHDMDVANKTDSTGKFPVLSAAEARAMNVAGNDKWRGSEYDPARMPLLSEVLALAARHQVGIMFDIKESVTDTATVALMAREAGVVPLSVFIPYLPVRAEAIKAAVPEARLNFSTQVFSDAPGGVTPGVLFAAAKEYGQFGSSLPSYTPERIAEVHDGCGLVVPNVYQGEVTGTEAGDLAHARAIGADGAQVNRPDVAADGLDRPGATTLAVGSGTACLVDTAHGLGLPGKLVLVDGTAVTTRRGGCLPLPASVGSVTWPGDGSTLASGWTAPVVDDPRPGKGPRKPHPRDR